VYDGLAAEHSPFARKLLETLEGKSAAGGIVTALDIYSSVQLLAVQHPDGGPMAGSDGDFVFMRRH
jgi:hypothetical protein